MLYCNGSKDVSSTLICARQQTLFAFFTIFLVATPCYNFFSSHQSGNGGKYHLGITNQGRLALTTKHLSTTTVEKEIPFFKFPQLSPFFFKSVPINSCNKELLTTIAGVGPALANNILSTRDRIGVFKSKDDLLQVPGIGTTRMEQFSEQVSFALPDPSL